MINRLINGIKDLLFPKFCAGCQKEGSWLCDKCLPAAFVGAAEPNGCAAAGEAGHLDGVTALFDYGENLPSTLIKMFKYNYLLEIGGIFEKIINQANFNNTWPGFVIIPVPLHLRRERERGFNQAEVLARIFSKKFGLVINKNLRRGIYTTQQAKLSREQRLVNLKDAFSWIDNAKMAPEKVLLVDDVFTTGATMQECAKVLKSNGTKIVCGFALARD